MKIEELLEQGRKKIEKSEDSNLICKIVLAYFLKQDKLYLIMNKKEEVPIQIQKQYEEAIKKIAHGYPLQYITHNQEFMKLHFYVDENVLIPRPDTEILVEEILNLVAKEESIKILDMCTGSGAIGISLAKYLPKATVYLSDISSNALQIAEKNARINGVDGKIQIIHSDMFQNIPKIPFDIIISNPPYIETETILTLEKQVQKEPGIALDGGIDGLGFYRILAQESYQFLKPEGILGVEIGYNQKEKVTELLEMQGKYKEIRNKQDLAGNDRIIIAKRR